MRLDWFVARQLSYRPNVAITPQGKIEPGVGIVGGRVAVAGDAAPWAEVAPVAANQADRAASARRQLGHVRPHPSPAFAIESA